MTEKEHESMKRRYFLRSLVMGAGAGGFLGMSRLAKAMAQPLAPGKLICYNGATGGYDCTGSFSCSGEFYCQHFTCDATPSNEVDDFNCNNIFSCPGQGAGEKFECLNSDILTANFNCKAEGTGGNFTCNPGSGFSCADFWCAPNKFFCVGGHSG